MISSQSTSNRVITAFIGVGGFALIGLIDYLSGTEIRVYPLYFLPLSIGTWHFGRIGGIASATGATLAWLISNRAAGMIYNQDYLWIVNTLAQFLAFLSIAFMLACTRELLQREERSARIDTITGLPNQRAFYEFAEVSLASCIRHARPITFAYLDIDNFKDVNDRHGHAHGFDSGSVAVIRFGCKKKSLPRWPR